MTLLRNIINPKVIKDINDEHLVSIYLKTGEWETFKIVESKPIYKPIVESKPKKK